MEKEVVCYRRVKSKAENISRIQILAWNPPVIKWFEILKSSLHTRSCFWHSDISSSSLLHLQYLTNATLGNSPMQNLPSKIDLLNLQLRLTSFENGPITDAINLSQYLDWNLFIRIYAKDRAQISRVLSWKARSLSGRLLGFYNLGFKRS